MVHLLLGDGRGGEAEQGQANAGQSGTDAESSHEILSLELVGHSGHLAALLSTATARLSALLAMAHRRMTLAFLGALVANPSTQLAVGLGAFARAAHRGSCGLANLSAVDVKRDASRKHLHVLLSKALRCAVIAGLGTRVAGLNAVGKALMGHLGLLRVAQPAGAGISSHAAAPDE
jgi:hypothetical protein